MKSPPQTASAAPRPCAALPPGGVREECGTPYAAWIDLIQPYVKNYGINRCPSGLPTNDGYEPRHGALAPPGNNPENLRWNYNINYIYVRGNCKPGVRDNAGGGSYPWSPHCAFGRSLATISTPADLIAVIEGRATSPDIRNAITNLRCRHNAGCNYVFADGHAAWKKFAATLVPRFLWIDDAMASPVQMLRQRDYYQTQLRTNNTMAHCR